MRIMSELPKLLVIAFAIGAVVIVIKQMSGPTTGGNSRVKVPALSGTATEGKKLFDANCKVCHGANASGTRRGPSFINAIYRRNHHGDGAFYMAVKQGARAHHWPFGNMPPLPQVNEAQVEKIVAYVRELQAANGL